jgi:adenylosuccinate synthase
MSVTIIIGGQWGDEGKAKIIDFLASDADYVVRFQGGANAGHTVVVGEERFAFHLVPSGILYPRISCILGGGMVIDPAALSGEIEMVKKRGIDVRNRIFISEQAHVVLPYHIMMDLGLEARKGSGCIGTTGKGISPAYVDKVAREGMRMGEFLRPAGDFSQYIMDKVKEKNRRLKLLGFKTVSPSKTEKEMSVLRKKLRPLIADTRIMLWDAIDRGDKILCEGAQGTLLDIDHGTYPFVTSSSSTASGAAMGSGIPPNFIERSVGIMKAYCTRVGNGPFPTELSNKVGQKLRDIGNEYGTTTGRPRRCGWFDAVAARTAVRLNGFTEIALTKMDVLDSFDEIKVATSYRVGRRRLDHFPVDAKTLARCRPQYETVEGWKKSFDPDRNVNLPRRAADYVKFLERVIGCRVSMVSVGPERQAIFQR